MGHWSSLASDKEGVSNVVAVVLLVGLTLTGVVVILATGWVSINETNQQADMEIAEESMLQIDSTLEQSGGGNTTIDVPNELNGRVTVSNDQTYTLTLNNNSECSTGARPLSSIEYDDNGQAVAYEGGGVWRMTESGATPVSPPDVAYTQGSLSVSFMNISGDIQSTSELRVTTNATEQQIHQANLSRALYTEGTYTTEGPDTEPVCPRSQVENATLTIQNSQYARAWAEWARDNHNSSLVTVTDPSTLGPGDTVTIQYRLGDVSPTEFTVSDLRAARTSSSGSVTVTARVTNTGGLRNSQAVSFEYTRQNGTVIASESKTLRLGEDESTVVQFNISDSAVESGTNDITVRANNTITSELTFDNRDGVPNTVLDARDVPDSAGVGAELDGTNVTVENNGNMTAFERVTLTVDGDGRATWDIVVPPNGEENVTVGGALPTGNTGTLELRFSGRIATNAPERDPFIVGESGYFRINSVSPPTDVDAGSTVTVSTTVKNTGAESLEDDITIEIRNEDTNSQVTSTTETPDLLGTASPAGPESTTVSLDTTLNTIGNYSYQVITPNGTQSGRFYVGPQSGPNFVITSLSVSDNPVDLGNQTTFDVKLTNTGTESAAQTVWLNNSATDETIESRRDIQLDPSESESVSWSVVANTDRFINGTNRLNVSTENVTLPTTLTIKDPDRFNAGDGTITIQESVNASITMEGAELEYNGYNGYSGWYETSDPIVVTLVIENSTGTYERVLWEDVPGTGENVNQPLAEARMYRDELDNPYTEFLSLEPGTNVSLYATSYECWRNVDSGVDHSREGRSYDGYRCTDRGDVRLDISNDSKPNNVDPNYVVIRGDGDQVPKYDAAYEGQLTLEQMLGPGQVEEVDGEGVLNLGQDEEVFLFELSDENAFPGNETRPVVGDFNDAIARFEVIKNNRTVKTPARFEIIDVDVPARVNSGDTATMDVTVRNNGGTESSTPLRMSFDGNAQVVSKTTDKLGNNETDTVTFTLDTDSRATGTYDWTVNATETDNAEQFGFVTVGNPPTPFFQVSAVNGPGVADIDDSPNATITIANTGAVDDTQTVVLEAKNEDTGGSWTQVDAQSLAIDAGNSQDITLDLPSTKANYSYRVATDNVTTSALSLLVGQSNVYVPVGDSINIGSEDEDAGSLIERKGGITEQMMNVKVANNGTVGDTRDIRLSITNASGAEVFNDTAENKQVGGGDLTRQSPVPAYVNYDPNLGTGFYTYTITVYNDTTSESLGYEVTGDMYLRETSNSGGSDSSPVSIDSGTITVG
ncbi:DUF7289 family protein [Haloarcula laminariae]|uniref:DUF7289 family protein n=1 Tax=Haloarcula laminariae TaxID=2961577 RepID=UPI002405C073|nr:hypothetical protein [Halomicroarcula sp. FL173]